MSTIFSTISATNIVSFRVTTKVNAASGATLTATVNASSEIQDPGPGANSASATVRVVDLVPFTEAKKISIDAEGHHVLVLRRGTVWAWDNFFGQWRRHEHATTPRSRWTISCPSWISARKQFLGGVEATAQSGRGATMIRVDSEPDQRHPLRKPSGQVIGLSSVTAIAASLDHVMALRSDGTVWTWGSNTIGQLGTGLTVGTLDFTAHPTPVQVPGSPASSRSF